MLDDKIIQGLIIDCNGDDEKLLTKLKQYCYQQFNITQYPARVAWSIYLKIKAGKYESV